MSKAQSGEEEESEDEEEEVEEEDEDKEKQGIIYRRHILAIYPLSDGGPRCSCTLPLSHCEPFGWKLAVTVYEDMLLKKKSNFRCCW